MTSTLTRSDYCSPGVFAADRDRIFHRGWCYVSHASGIAIGGRRVVDIVGESLIVTRDRSGRLGAFANVCRHRGARLCDPTEPTDGGERATAIQCPYHAWTYRLDGSLATTPRVDPGDIDRSANGLWPHRVAEWNGMVFVSLAAEGPELHDWLNENSPDLFDFASIPIGELDVFARTSTNVGANWKIIVENYAECLHCPIVHPELTEVIPLYHTGSVVDPDRTDGAAVMAGRSNAYHPASTLPVLPGITDRTQGLYRGTSVFPNVFVDVVGSGIALTAMFPVAPDRTLVVGEYLFAPGADAAAAGAEVAFNERIGAQDYAVCERVQQGVASRAFAGGTLTSKDALVAEFDRHYRSARGRVSAT